MEPYMGRLVHAREVSPIPTARWRVFEHVRAMRAVFIHHADASLVQRMVTSLWRLLRIAHGQRFRITASRPQTGQTAKCTRTTGPPTLPTRTSRRHLLGASARRICTPTAKSTLLVPHSPSRTITTSTLSTSATSPCLASCPSMFLLLRPLPHESHAYPARLSSVSRHIRYRTCLRVQQEDASARGLGMYFS